MLPRIGEPLTGLGDARRACLGVHLRRGGPTEGEHPPGARLAVMSLAEPDVHHRVGLDQVWDTAEPIEQTLSRLDRLVERLSQRSAV